jgi:hypothetical protein
MWLRTSVFECRRRVANTVVQMKKIRSETKGRLLPASMADTELQHIERALAQLRAMRQHAPGALNVGYWHERLAAVASTYALVPAQKRQVETLRRALDTIAHGPRDTTPSRKKTTNRLWAKAA